MKTFVLVTKQESLSYPVSSYDWKNNLLYFIKINDLGEVVLTDEIILDNDKIYCRDNLRHYKVACNPENTYFFFNTSYRTYPKDMLLGYGLKAINYPFTEYLTGSIVYLLNFLKDKVPILPFKVNAPLKYPFISRDLEKNVYYYTKDERVYTALLNELDNLITFEYINRPIQLDYNVVTAFGIPLATFIRVSVEKVSFVGNLYKNSVWIAISHLTKIKSIMKPEFPSYSDCINEWKPLDEDETKICSRAIENEFRTNSIEKINKSEKLKTIENIASKASKEIMLGLGSVDVITDNSKGKAYVMDVHTGMDSIHYKIFNDKSEDIFLFRELSDRGFFK